MMGRKVRAFMALVNVSLEELVPQDHFYRHVERTLDLSFVRELVTSCYAPIGRPSVDPVVFFKLQLVMFFEGMRSERQLMAVAADRLSVRWYLGYDLHETLPDHSSLSKIRDRYGVTIFRRFFDCIVEQCQQAGLVWGKELYFDSTQVEANADRDKMLPRFYVDAVNKHLATLFPDTDATPQEEPGLLAEPNPLPLPVNLPPDVEADLAAKNATRRDWVTELGRPDRAETHGNYQRQSDVWVNTTDPDATLMHKKGGGTAIGYHTHYVVDGGKARIILDVLVTPSEVMDNQPMLDLLWHVCFRWHLQPDFACGDTTYGTVENIVGLEDAGIRAYTPLPDFDQRTPFFGKQRFTYEADQDQYRCPNGAILPRRKAKYTERVIVYRAEAEICNACPLKAKCTESDQGRMVTRHFDESYLELVRSYHSTESYKKAMRKRKVWVEPLFGEGKAWHGMERFRLRMLEKVNIEGLVRATGQNLKRLLSWRGWGRRWWPGGAAGVVIPADFWSNSSVPA
ncbi:MAG TPA: IS1182 family transposase [Herpetosiphonaceae bacterium]|nr:IS1182 family transposase [Herpetosiphonaceae bacterium]